MLLTSCGAFACALVRRFVLAIPLCLTHVLNYKCIVYNCGPPPLPLPRFLSFSFSSQMVGVAMMIAGAVVSVACSPSPAASSSLASPDHMSSPDHLSHVLSVAGLEPLVLLSSKSRDRVEFHSDCCSPPVPESPSLHSRLISPSLHSRLTPLVSPLLSVSFFLSPPFPLPFPLLFLLEDRDRYDDRRY